MNRAQLEVSRALWRSREKYRYAKWHYYIGAERRSKDPERKAKLHALRAKWSDSYRDALHERRRRDIQISKLPINEVDAAGLRFIKGHEGFVKGLYHDTRGFCTGGTGHLVRDARCNAADHKKYDDYSEREWLALLDKDLDRFEAAVRSVTKRAKVKVNQNMFNALVSFAFNIGENGFKGSSTARQLKAGNKRAAGDAMFGWLKPPELRGRRTDEVNLFFR